MDISRAYQLLKNIYHYIQSYWWRLYYGFPDKALMLYGVTGTNGKTTTSYILTGILAEHVGTTKVGMLTTVGIRIGEKEFINKTKMTTLPSRSVFRYMKEMKKQGVTHCVLEITSHALDQHRLAGVMLAGGIILNLEREHLDYHKTMEGYARAKAKIASYLAPNAPLVVKRDNTWIEKMIPNIKRGRPDARVIEFTSQDAKNVVTPLTGDVNKENVLAASLLSEAVGVSRDHIQSGVANATHVPGRMDWIETDKGFKVLIDYAVTPEALDRLYSYVKEVTPGNILAIVGAAGLRDRGKRPDMAKTVAKYAHEIVITREDPWTEPEEQIFSDLEEGLTEFSNFKRIEDRKDAISYLISKAKQGDTVVVTGKGAEQGMGIGKDIIPWNDKDIITDLLKEL